MGLKKCIYSTYSPLSFTHLWLRCSNFFNPAKKNSFGCAANRKIGNRKSQRFIGTTTYFPTLAENVSSTDGNNTHSLQHPTIARGITSFGGLLELKHNLDRGVTGQLHVSAALPSVSIAKDTGHASELVCMLFGFQKDPSANYIQTHGISYTQQKCSIRNCMWFSHGFCYSHSAFT
jgi:hypothetical protein